MYPNSLFLIANILLLNVSSQDKYLIYFIPSITSEESAKRLSFYINALR